MHMNLSKLREIAEDIGAWHATVRGVTKSWIQLSDLITTATTIYIYTHIYTYVYSLRYAYDTTLMAESEELKSLLKAKEESEKVGLKCNIQKTKIMASSPITSWEIDGETVETVVDFIFLGSKITANGDCSHEIKRCLLLGRSDDQPRQHIKKQRYYFANKGPSSQGYGFSSSHVWM